MHFINAIVQLSQQFNVAINLLSDDEIALASLLVTNANNCNYSSIHILPCKHSAYLFYTFLNNITSNVGIIASLGFSLDNLLELNRIIVLDVETFILSIENGTMELERFNWLVIHQSERVVTRQFRHCLNQLPYVPRILGLFKNAIDYQKPSSVYIIKILECVWIRLSYDNTIQNQSDFNYVPLPDYEKDIFQPYLNEIINKLQSVDPETDYQSQNKSNQGIISKLKYVLYELGPWSANQIAYDYCQIKISRKRKQIQHEIISSFLDVDPLVMGARLNLIVNILKNILKQDKDSIKIAIAIERHSSAKVLAKILSVLSDAVLLGLRVLYLPGSANSKMKYHENMLLFEKGEYNTIVYCNGTAFQTKCSFSILLDDFMSLNSRLKLKECTANTCYWITSQIPDDITSSANPILENEKHKDYVVIKEAGSELYINDMLGINHHKLLEMCDATEFEILENRIRMKLEREVEFAYLETHADSNEIGVRAATTIFNTDGTSVRFQSDLKASSLLAKQHGLFLLYQHLFLLCSEKDGENSISEKIDSMTFGNGHFSSIILLPLDGTKSCAFSLIRKTPFPEFKQLELEGYRCNSSTHIIFNRNEFESLLSFQKMIWTILLSASPNPHRAGPFSDRYMICPMYNISSKKWEIDWALIKLVVSTNPDCYPTLANLISFPETEKVSDFYSLYENLIKQTKSLTKSDISSKVSVNLNLYLSLILVVQANKSYFYRCHKIDKLIKIDDTLQSKKEEDIDCTYRQYFSNRGYQIKETDNLMIPATRISLYSLKYNEENGPACFLLPSLSIIYPLSSESFKSFSYLPAALSKLDFLMPIVEFQKEYDIDDIPIREFSKAFVAPSTREIENSDRLEFVGDSFLKFVVSRNSFLEHFDWNEGLLSKYRADLISNSNLYRIGTSINLHNMIISEPIVFEKWIPPFHSFLDIENREVPKKLVSDCFEAILGAIIIYANCKKVDDFLVKTKLLFNTIHIENIIPDNILSQNDLEMINRVEVSLNYVFRKKHILILALDNMLKGSPSFGSLAFIGDSVLEFTLTRYLFFNFPNETPGSLTKIRQAILSNRYFAQLSVEYALVNNFNHNENTIKEFMESNESKLNSKTFLHYYDAPKILGDLWEAVAGAIIIDLNWDLDTFWEIYLPLLIKDLNFQPDSAWLKNPIAEITAIVGDTIQFSFTQDHLSGLYTCNISNFKRDFGCGTGVSKNSSKCMASYNALQRLKPSP